MLKAKTCRRVGKSIVVIVIFLGLAESYSFKTLLLTIAPPPPPSNIVSVPTPILAFSLFSTCHRASLFFMQVSRGCVIFCHLFIISHFDNFHELTELINFDRSSPSTVTSVNCGKLLITQGVQNYNIRRLR